MSITLAFARKQPAPGMYLSLCGILEFAALLAIPVGLRWSSSIFLTWARCVDDFVRVSDKRALTNWYNAEMRFFEGSRAMVGAGALLGVLAETAYFFGCYFDKFTPSAGVWAGAVVFVSAFFAGCSLWAMYCASVAVYNLGKTWGRQIVVAPGRWGILCTGRALAKCWLIVGLIWFIYGLSTFFGPPTKSAADVLTAYPILLVAAPTLPIVLVTFIRSQWPMHLAMIDYKRRELRRLDAMLSDVTPTAANEASENARETLEFLLRRRTDTDALPEWPFDLVALTKVTSSAVYAAIPPFLSLWMPVAKSLGHFAG